MNLKRGAYLLTDDQSKLDLDVVCTLLQATYWAASRSRAQIEKSIHHSVCFGLFHAGQQVGFARAVTDRATYCYLCDVIIAPEHRGHGLGKWIVECMLAHPDLQTTTQCLRTRDAHGLYEAFGFERTEYMRRSANDWSKQKPGSSS
jgi:GNAT superfamily N-acetyltransferase